MRSKSLTRLALLTLLASGCGKSESPPSPPTPVPSAPAAPQKPSAAELRVKATALFGALPEVASASNRALSEPQVQLGRVLYAETRLSKNQDLACVSCHALDGFGIDTRPAAVERGTSFGHKNQFGDRNTPTVFNAALQFVQFWDGRAADVEAQAKGPVLNPVEMAMPDEASVVRVLKSIPGYEPLFKAAFPGEPDPITYQNMANAMGAFERKLLTPAAFDRFLAGDDAALDADQLEGLGAFVDAGCIACHNGPGFGGRIYQKLGLLKPYATKDEGRAKISGNPADKFFFKVPALRNVVKTGPYFHDGSIKSLKEAISIMSDVQTPGGKLADDKIAKIEAFLAALTGEAPAALIAKPELPPSGPKTPAPDPG